MHFVLTAYATVGDMRGVDDVIARMLTMGLTATSTTINIVLRSIVNNQEMDWDAFTSCYFEHFGFQKFVADIDTYAVLLDACEKYDRPLDAAKWFKQMLSVGAYPTPPIRDTFQRILGDEKFEVFRSGLPAEYRSAMAIIDRKAAPFPGRHNTASEEFARRTRLKATPLMVPDRAGSPRSGSRDKAAKDVSLGISHNDTRAESHNDTRAEQEIAPTQQTESILEPAATTPTRSWTPRDKAVDEVPLNVSFTAPAVTVIAQRKAPPSLNSLIVLGEKGDFDSLHAMIEELKVEGSVPIPLLMESLIYAHMKALDTVAARRVVDDMKIDNIDVSRKSFDYLMQAYSDDGDGPGAEMVASQALSMGYALGVSSTSH